jgi:hypothetical protein
VACSMYNCLDSLTAGLKHTTAVRMIAHRYLGLYQRVLGWFFGLASELELAHSGAVLPANINGWAVVPVPATGRITSPFSRPPHTEQTTAVLEHFVMVGDGKGRISCICCGTRFTSVSEPDDATAQARLPLCAQASRLYCYLSTTKMPSEMDKYIYSIFRAGVLEPHWPESCAWHNRELIRPLCMC